MLQSFAGFGDRACGLSCLGRRLTLSIVGQYCAGDGRVKVWSRRDSYAVVESSVATVRGFI